MRPDDETRTFEAFARGLGYQDSAFDKREGGDYALGLTRDMLNLYRAGAASQIAEINRLRRTLRNIAALAKQTALPPKFAHALKGWMENVGIKESLLR